MPHFNKCLTVVFPTETAKFFIENTCFVEQVSCKKNLASANQWLTKREISCEVTLPSLISVAYVAQESHVQQV